MAKNVSTEHEKLQNAFAVAGIKDRDDFQSLDVKSFTKSLVRLLKKEPSRAGAFIQELTHYPDTIAERLAGALTHSDILHHANAVRELLACSKQVSDGHDERWYGALDEWMDLWLSENDKYTAGLRNTLDVLIDHERVKWTHPIHGNNLIVEVILAMEAVQYFENQEDTLTDKMGERIRQRGRSLLNVLVERGLELTANHLVAACEFHNKSGTGSSAIHAVLDMGCPLDGIDYAQLSPACQTVFDDNAHWRAHVLKGVAQEQRRGTPGPERKRKI